MSFDISAADIAGPSDEGRTMEIRVGGNVLKDPDGNPVAVTLLGQYSRALRQKEREFQLRRIEQSKLGVERTADDIERENTEYLVAATASWTFDTLDGQPFSCTPDNARRFWSDPRFANQRARALNFISADANFFRRAA